MAWAPGIVEGFYGRPWTDAERLGLLPFAAGEGFGSYLYAPKSDHHLRDGWRTEHAHSDAERLRALSDACREHAVRFGIGLSPMGLHDDPKAGRDALVARVRQLMALGIDFLALLFDDMRGDRSNLARVQADLVAAAADVAGVELWTCPTYYSDDPLLDDRFGVRPAGYLEQLGKRLDPAIGVLWTGPLVRSPVYGADHLARVSEALRRKPILWDNYPVNDGPVFERRLQLAAFEERDVTDTAAGLLANPMTQPWLSRLPLWTLPRRLARDPRSRSELTRAAFEALLPAELAATLLADAPRFMDPGLDGLDRAATLQTYAGFEHLAAHEVGDWLRGV